jgi:hypothetical protein
MKKNNRIRTNALKALSLTLAGFGGVALASGCGDSTGAGEEVATSTNALASFPASAETTKASSIVAWNVVRGDHGIHMEGVDANDELVNSIHLQVVQEEQVVRGVPRTVQVFEVTTSGGGVLRATGDGQVLEAIADPIAFDALSRDIAPYLAEHEELSAYNCDFWGWAACYAASATAGVACATPPFIQCTLAIITMGIACGPCWTP